MPLIIGGYSNPVTDSIRHDWAINHAEYSGIPYSLRTSQQTRNAHNLPPAEMHYSAIVWARLQERAYSDIGTRMTYNADGSLGEWTVQND